MLVNSRQINSSLNILLIFFCVHCPCNFLRHITYTFLNRCYRRGFKRAIVEVCNPKCTSQSHIGQLIEARRHSLFGHVVRLPPTVPCDAILRLTQDISMGRRIPPGWWRPRGWPRASWTSQLKRDTWVPTATSWRRAVDRQLWREDATALTSYAIWRWWRNIIS